MKLQTSDEAVRSPRPNRVSRWGLDCEAAFRPWAGTDGGRGKEMEGGVFSVVPGSRVATDAGDDAEGALKGMPIRRESRRPSF